MFVSAKQRLKFPITFLILFHLTPAFVVSMTKSKLLPLKKFQLKQDEIVLCCLQAEENRQISQQGITEIIPNLSITSICNRVTESFGIGSIFEDIWKPPGYNPGQPALDQTTSRDHFQPQSVPMTFFPEPVTAIHNPPALHFITSPDIILHSLWDQPKKIPYKPWPKKREYAQSCWSVKEMPESQISHSVWFKRHHFSSPGGVWNYRRSPQGRKGCLGRRNPRLAIRKG